MKRARTFAALAVGCAVALAAPTLSAARGPKTPAAKLSQSLAKRLSSYDPQVRDVLAKMTLDEKIGQMTQAEQDALKDVNDIDKYHLGSLLSGGNSDPKAGNSMQAWTDMYMRYQAVAMKTRLGIPILFGVDAVHGHSNVLGAVLFPHNIGLGATRDPQLVEKASRVTAEEVRATGIHWAFAPCVTVPRDERWGRTYEGFGESPELAKMFGGPATFGLQGSNLASSSSVLACAKHFAGDGGTTYGTGTKKGDSDDHWPMDRGDTRLSEEELKALHMQGYVTAIQAGAGSIMPSYSSWNGVKCSGSKRLLTDILKDEMGFEGFLISDYAAIDELPGDYKSDVETSINAGMDMVMVPNKYQEFFETLKALVNEGKVPMSRIDDAVTRILRVKFAMGLMAKGYSPAPDKKLVAAFGSTAHREVARQCVRESLVLLKNDNKVLPLSKRATRIHVGGKSADDIGNQCGGWTIAWQGQSGNVTTGGTTILAAIRGAVGKSTKVTFSKDGSGAEGAAVGVVVIGETPYAEMFGDRTDLAISDEDVAAVEAMKRAGIPVVVVLFSGRPMILDRILDKADAIVAAWLPGTEGRGVTDVLFGNAKFTGKLPVSWPRSMAQLPINVGDTNYDPLFPYGYGLTY